MYIYVTTNLINGKSYIGLSKSGFTPSYMGSGELITKAIKRYGRENFQVQLLECTDSIEHLCRLERAYIKRYRSLDKKLYNIADGGNVPPSWKGKIRPLETRRKMSESRKGIVYSSETRAKMSQAAKARRRPHTAATKEKLRQSKLGSKNSNWKGGRPAH